MKQKIERLFSKMSLFWRYFFLLAVVVCVFLIAFSVTTRQFSKTLQGTYLEQAQGILEKNAALFDRELSLFHSLPLSLEETEHYTTVASRTQPLDAGFVFHLSSFSKTFDLQCSLLDLPTESFVYFKRSQICLARERMFTNLESCFETYLVYDDMQVSMADMLRQDTLPRSSRLIPAREVSVGGQTGTYLTILVQSVGSEAVYGMLYPVDRVLDRFRIESLPENTTFRLIQKNGTVLASHAENQQAEDEDYIYLTCELPALSCTASVGIPGSYFDNAIRSSQKTAQLIFLLSVVISVIMCLLFSHISVRPLRRLIRDHSGEQVPHAPANELAAIDSVLKDAREKNAALRNVMLSSLLVRAFSGLTIPEGEYRKISASFPMFHRSLRAAVVRDLDSDGDIDASLATITLLRQTLPEVFWCEHINIRESIILFPSEPEHYEQLNSALQELNRESEQIRFVCGISAPFVGLEKISATIRQAQSCVPESAQHMIVQVAETGEDGAGGSENVDLKPLQQALECWNQQEVLEQIDHLAVFAGKSSKTPPQELFYSILFLLRDTAGSNKLSFSGHEKLIYQSTSSPTANLRRLKVIADDLFQQKSALQMTDKQILCEEIVQHIKNNFSDATLCMASLAKRFGVSERFVYNAVLDSTGMNVSSFLARCRMQEAARLLRETQETIGSIAEKCGYPVESTFYRNFKKYYHVTPAEYKAAY